MKISQVLQFVFGVVVRVLEVGVGLGQFDEFEFGVFRIFMNGVKFGGVGVVLVLESFEIGVEFVDFFLQFFVVGEAFEIKRE